MFEPNPCPKCGKAVYISFLWEEWACSDPECENAHGKEPGGGISLHDYPFYYQAKD